MDISKKVIRLKSTRVWRTYYGGRETEKWQGLENPQDGDLPEEWIASTVTARNPGREHIVGEGLSRIYSEDGKDITLKEIIESDPEGFLGKGHVKRNGSSLAFLTKIIDSLNRLAIQVHPTKDFSREYLHSEFGKTEAWYILGGRAVNGEEPYVLLGFKPGVTRENWKRMFDEQDIPGMQNALHKINVKPGEMYYIPGGVPHAIGSGCFLIEIQEPTDYTMRVERTTPEGRKINDFLCHQGVGFDKMLDCFSYDGYTKEQMLEQLKIAPNKTIDDENGSEELLIGQPHTDLFRMKRLSIIKSLENNLSDTFCSAVVYSGTGKIEYGNESLNIKQGDLLFIPFGVDKVTWVNDTKVPMTIIECFPPKV